MKRCTKCGAEKGESEFYSDRSRRSGLSDGCKSCVLVERAAHRAANREKLKLQARVDRRLVPERGIWHAMNARCASPASTQYANYGGRGIRVCDRWRGSFEAFVADMGPRPSASHSIDRIDVNGHYEPGNCRWATQAEQSRNKRDNRLVTAFGKTLCLAQWADETGVPASVIGHRISRDWSAEAAVTTPPAVQRRGGLTIRGETLSVLAWSKRVGLSRHAIDKRLNHGWTPEDAVFTPRQAGGRPRKAA